MATMINDTLKFTRTLQAAGMPSEQAEALADAINEHGTDPASKNDIALLRSELDGRLLRMELRLYVGQLATLAVVLGVVAKVHGWL